MVLHFVITCYNGINFTSKIDQFLDKIGSNLAKIWSIFLAISRGAFLARNVSQNHFSFSREMREMCRSNTAVLKKA